MSFDRLKEADLREVAEAFGTDVPEPGEGTAAERKALIRKALEDDGVTWEMWQDQQTLAAEEAEDDAEPEVPVAEDPQAALEQALATSKAQTQISGQVLVKMERANPRYDTQGYTFTKDHPYQLMPADKAQRIFDLEEGFRMAQPREVEEFYG